jgi:nucleoside-diphosphate-sugar epimerase
VSLEITRSDTLSNGTLQVYKPANPLRLDLRLFKSTRGAGKLSFVPPNSDIQEILENEKLLQGFENSRILITGASGFVGTWLATSLFEANIRYNLNLKLSLLCRDTNKISITDPGITLNFITHNLLNPITIPDQEFDYVFHTATPSQPSTGGTDPALVYQTATVGTENLLKFVGNQHNPPKFLHTSSGAVDRLNSEIPESEIQKAYRLGKLEAEELVSGASMRGEILGVNPRLYAFAGPGIATDAHFASGFFLRSALDGVPISIQGNPETIRSYMYPTDLVAWLLRIIQSPTTDVIRIGSSKKVTILELAELILSLTGNGSISNRGNPKVARSIYTPDLSDTLNRYEVGETVVLEESLLRWAKYLRPNI